MLWLGQMPPILWGYSQCGKQNLGHMPWWAAGGPGTAARRPTGTMVLMWHPLAKRLQPQSGVATDMGQTCILRGVCMPKPESAPN